MTGEIILAAYGGLAAVSCAGYVFVGWLFRRGQPKGTDEGGISQTELERLMQAKHGDDWQAMLQAWSLGDE